MTSKDGYVIADRDEVVRAGSCNTGYKKFWLKFYRENGTGGCTEPITDKELWDNRTYADITFYTPFTRIDMAKRFKRMKWVDERPHGSKSPMGIARLFLGMEGVHIEKDGVMYKVSSGDAEALMMGYMTFDEMDKEVSKAKYNYLKI